MNIFESKEDYLERILMLKENNTQVRAIDIASSMSFSRASVSIALKKLINDNYIIVDKQTGNIELTDNGLIIANEVYQKHKIISSFLESIGVSKENALIDACKIEHDICDETLNKMKEHLNK